MTTVSSQTCTFAVSHIHSISGHSPRKATSKISENQQIRTPQQPWTAPDIRQLSAAPNQHQLPVSNTSQQHQNQLPVSTTRQQHHISQPPARHPANQLSTLLPCHTHIMAARSVVQISCDYFSSIIF